MDALQESDIEIARTTPPAEKLRQALQMVETGIRLKRTGLRVRHPSATPEQIEEMVQRWLESDE
jgi:hypothetical protein